MPTGSQELKKHLENKGFFEIKQKAIQLCPAGAPNFALILDPNNSSQISVWNREFGKETTAKLIFVVLEDLNNYFNVSRPMNTGQMTDLAIEITDALWSYKFEDIIAFSESIKKQTYGKVYERLDPAIIWEHLGYYNEARERHLFAEVNKYKQYDPRIEDESEARVTRGFTGLAGAINRIKGNLKP